MSGYSTPGFFEKKIERETAARVAAFLGGLERGSENLGATGVRSDWMEQDGPADCVREKIFAVGWKIRPGAVFAYRKTTERYGHYLISGL